MPCLPGAKITGREDGIYHGEFTLRVGPFAAAHRGTVRIEDADADARVQRLSVGGSPRNGSSATIVNTLTETDGGTRVDAVADLTLAGPLAVFVGSGVIEDVANRLLRDFATCLAGRLNAPAAPTGADVTAGKAAPEQLPAAAPQDPADPESTGG